MSSIVTVCVLTYNPDWVKFRNTLRSIICQEGVDFDIVISDDGSKYNCFDKAEDFFKENNFTAYRLLAIKNNQGTVKNVISALQHTDSKYVKLISPGDFLYDENVLAEFVEFAEKNPAAAYFGTAVYYSVNEENEIKIYETLHNPRDLKPWIENDLKKIRISYIVNRDYILGASFFCNRGVLFDYVKRIENKVKYAEDFNFIWQVVDGKRILFFYRPFVFYEYGIGISTISNGIWAERLHTDEYNVYKLMYGNNVISRIEFLSLCSKKRFLRLFYRSILSPLYVFQQVLKQKYNCVMEDKEGCLQRLEQILN